MEDFVLEQWEIVQERSPNREFSPLQVGIAKKSEEITGLISEEFGERIEYAGDQRIHNSIAATREEERRKLALEKEREEQVVLTQEQLDQMIADAYQRGRDETIAESVEANNSKFTLMEEQMKIMLSDMVEQERAALADVEQSALSLSLEIAKKIVDHAVEINPEYILQILREALQLSGGARVKKVRVSPQDMEFIQVLKVAQSLKEFDGSWNFEADESVRTGCILESSAGLIDFQLDKAWERIRDKILTSK